MSPCADKQSAHCFRRKGLADGMALRGWRVLRSACWGVLVVLAGCSSTEP